jgi:hypothetical protein
VSIGVVLLVSWIFYWHILFIKEREKLHLEQRLTNLFSQAYNKLLSAKDALDSSDLTQCKKLLSESRELFNRSISNIQNIPGDITPYVNRSEFWKFYVNLLQEELENGGNSSKKWLYIF